MADGVYDVIVIGAGVMGSSTAYHLAKKNKRTLILEQFPLLHHRGSSHGHSRITRLAYPEQFYTNMMTDAFRMLEELENETGTNLYVKCGCLSMGREDSAFLREVQNSLEGVGALHECLTPGQLRQRFPMFSYPDDFGGILDHKGGLIKADCYLRAVQTVFRQRGGEIRDCEPVVNINPGSEVIVTTTKGRYRAASVVIAVGPWSDKLLRPLGLHLPVKTVRVTVAYWKETELGSHSQNRFPCFIDHNGSPPYDVWGLPSYEYPGYAKVTLHTGPEISPEARDQPDGKWVIDRISNYVKKHLPGLQSPPSIVEQCVYTNTPDENFILDHHHRYKNVVVAAGFSGHGFKLAPPVGLALSDMAIGRTPKYDMEPFKIARFTLASNL